MDDIFQSVGHVIQILNQLNGATLGVERKV